MKTKYILCAFEFSLLFFITSCSTYNHQTAFIPKDTYEAVSWLQENIPLEDRLKIVSNNIDTQNFNPLIKWLAVNWQTSDANILIILKSYKKKLLSDGFDSVRSSYDDNSVYDKMDHFESSTKYFKFDYNKIPKLDNLTIKNDKLPKPYIRIISVDISHYNDKALNSVKQSTLKELCQLYGSSEKAVMKINNLTTEDLFEISSKKKRLILPIIEFPKVYDFMIKAERIGVKP